MALGKTTQADVPKRGPAVIDDHGFEAFVPTTSAMATEAQKPSFLR
jgi:hypothetical protein